MKTNEIIKTNTKETVKKAKSAYYDYYFNTAPINLEQAKNAKVNVVCYHKVWDEESGTYKRFWKYDKVLIKDIAKENYMHTKLPVVRETTLKNGDKVTHKHHYVGMNEFIKAYVINDNSDEKLKRQAWAHLCTELETINQSKINYYPIWERLSSAAASEKYHTITEASQSLNHRMKLGGDKDYLKQPKTLQEVMLLQAEDYGITPQEVTLYSKDTYTFQKSSLDLESDDVLLERWLTQQYREKVKKTLAFIKTYKPDTLIESIQQKVYVPLAKEVVKNKIPRHSECWLRPFNTYHTPERNDDYVTLVGRWKQTTVPNYKEAEAVAIAERIKRSPYANEFIETVEVWNKDYDVILPSFKQTPVLEALRELAYAKPTVISRAVSASVFSKVDRFLDYSSILTDIDYKYPDLSDDLHVLAKLENDAMLSTQTSLFIDAYNKLLDSALSDISKVNIMFIQSMALDMFKTFVGRRERTQVISKGEDFVKRVPKSEVRLGLYEEYELEYRDFQVEVDDGEFDEYEFLGYDREETDEESVENLVEEDKDEE